LTYAGGGCKNTATRSATKKSVKLESNVNDHQTAVDASKANTDELPQLGGVDKLPPVDTPEATGVSATR